MRVTRQEIALPPDTAFQRVAIDTINPKPEEMVKDTDGNWLAHYEVSPGQKLSIEAVISVTMRLPSLDGEIASSSGTNTGNDGKEYLKPLPYWESDDPIIKSLAAIYTTPKTIYEYVVSTLHYDYERVKTIPKRKGALEALKTPKGALCMEFTDLYIAIARAAGIPAREVVGYAHTTNATLRPLSLVTDVLHAWPEYYDRDRGIWIPIDPTWGSTTGGVDYFSQLDFSHIAFAIHGISSSRPLPAGFYREEGREGRDVTVEFLGEVTTPSVAKLIPRIEFPRTVTAGFRGVGMASVENTGGVEASDVSIHIETVPFSYTINKDHQTIAPFSKLSLPLTMSIPALLGRSKGRITMTVGDRSVEHSFDIQPISWLYVSLSGMIGSVGILLWIAIVRPFSKIYTKITPDSVGLAALTTRPGVYLYYNAHGIVLYVGKAKNLKKRVRQYFVRRETLTTKTQTLVPQISSIQTIATDSEFDALLWKHILYENSHQNITVSLKMIEVRSISPSHSVNSCRGSWSRGKRRLIPGCMLRSGPSSVRFNPAG